jgi:hypothetical protein
MLSFVVNLVETPHFKDIFVIATSRGFFILLGRARIGRHLGQLVFKLRVLGS